MAMTLPGLIVNLTLAHAQFTQGINQVNQQLGTLNRTVNIAKNALTGFLAGFGVQQMIALGRGAIDAAGGMAELAQQAGVSAKQLQILQFAGVQVGVSQEQLVTALSQLNVRLSRAEEGTGNLRTMLQRYNIATKDAQGNTRATADILADFADIIQDTASQTERGGIAAELFGSRVGSKLLPLLSQGSEGIRDFGRQVEQAGLLLGDEFLADADAASDALATLQLALQRGFQIGVISEFRDSVSSSIDAMREAKDAGEALGTIVGGALRLLAGAVETLVPLFKQLASEIDTISSAAEKIGNLAERFTGDAVAVELLNGDIGSLNEQIADLIGRRRELESTGVGSERAIAEINGQIEVFRRQREELIETRNQLQFVDTAEKNLGDTVPGTTAAIDEQIGRMAALAAQSKAAASELNKLAAIDMADVQFEISQQPLKRAQDEVATFERKWKETNENIVQITEDFTQRANQVRHQAQQDAEREAQQLNEQRAESIAGLEAEVAGTQKLVVAQSQGVDAIRDVEIAIQAYNKIRQLKLRDDSKEAQQIRSLVTALSDEEAARELAKEAAAQASAGSALHAEIRARGKQTEELRVQLKLLAIKDQLGNEAAEALEEEVRATERVRSSLAQVNAARGLEETIEEQRLLLGYAGEETEEYQIQLKLLQLKQSGIENITPEMRRQVELWAQQGAELEKLSAQEDAFGDALEHTAESVQSAFTGAYENIFSGGVDTFSDLAEEIKRIFIRLAAEIAALMTIRPLIEPLTGLGAGGVGGLFGAGAVAATANPAAGSLGTATGPGGLLVGGGVTSSLGAPATGIGTGFLGTGVAGRTLFGAGAFGGLGGALLAPMLFGGGPGTTIGGGLGGAGGAIGGALLGSIFPGVGTLLGGLGGGLLGGLGGGFLGSLFGGGGTSGNEASIGGGFGRAGAGGTGEAAKFVVDFDKQMSKLLNDRQLELADQALRAAKSVSVKYGDEGLSEGDRQRLAAGRVAPVAGALGFREKAFEGLGAEEALGQLQEALQLERTIEDLTGAVTPFKRSILDLRASFAETESRAKELGISTTGMGRALREAEQQLRDQRSLERSSLRLQLQAIIGSGSASRELAVAIAGIRLQFQGLREQAEALGLSLDIVKEAERAAIQQAKEAAQQLREQRQFERRSLTLQLQTIIGSGNASTQLALAILGIRIQFQGLRKDAEELGVSLKLVDKAEQELIKQTKDQAAADKAAAKAFLRDFTAGTEYQRQLNAINDEYQRAVALAREYNLSEKGLKDAKRDSIRALKDQTQAEIDAMALSVIDPFLALSNPLRDFVDDLERSLLSPVELFRVAQEDFRETARRAHAGDVEAIERLDETGRFYIEQAGRFGASPEQVSATQEVLHATQDVTRQVDISMREASKGITDEIRKASNRQDDTLKELVETSKDIVKELKRQR